MRNWFGQEIKVGDWVYRGAGAGNGSVYKIGRVKTMKPGKNPRVQWIFRGINNELCSHKGAGNPSVESLVVLDAKTVDILDIVETSLIHFKECPSFKDFFDSYGVDSDDYSDPRWRSTQLKFSEMKTEYEYERKRFINHRLAENGHPPIY